ncbi:MAG: hypothetical protein WD534_00230 [Phycisphaeraceae bacterium]
MMRWTLTLMVAGLLGMATVGCEREEPAPPTPQTDPTPTEEPASPPEEPVMEPASPPDDEPDPEPGS